MEKLELLDKILSKQLTWIAAADTKATFIFTINSAMLAASAALQPFPESWNWATTPPTTLSILLLLWSTCFIALAASPNLKGPQHSFVFFGGIAALKSDYYVHKVNMGVTQEIIDDYAKQCHRNAEIAAIKFSRIRKASTLSLAALPFWLISISLLYNIKIEKLLEPACR